MDFITTLRTEFTATHKEAETVIEKAATEKRDLTADEKEANEKRFSRLQQIRQTIDDQAKFAKLALDEGRVELPKQPEGKEVYEAAERLATDNKFDRKAFSKAASRWCLTGDMDRKYATITTATQNGILLPSEVTDILIANYVNTYREAMDVYGIKPILTANTAELKIPVMDPTAGGVVSETATSDTEQPPSLTESIDLKVATYQSGTAWFSNMALAAVDWDMISELMPQLIYGKELGLESAMTNGVIADSAITRNIPTATVSGFTYANLVSLNRALPKRYDKQKAIILSTPAYVAAENLTTTTGYPILNALDPQNASLKYFNGTPVFRSDYFASFGANNVVGTVFSLLGFRIRDCAGSQLTRYLQFSGRPNQTGFNYFAYHAWGYAPSAVAKLVCPAS